MSHRKVDFHAHFVPDVYRKALLDHGFTNPDGMPGIPQWSVMSHIDYMNCFFLLQAVGIHKSVLSISSPGTNITPDPSFNALLTRQTNEFASDVKRQHPDRFHFLASIPIDPSDPHLSAARAEITYALDTLNADGFVLLSNTQGLYLGDPRLRPLLADLDTRKALVFVHPTKAPCCHNGGGIPVGKERHASPAEQYACSAPLANVYRAPLFEFFFDSGRSILDLIDSGTIIRFPKIRWVVSHCGGVLPSLMDRMFLILRLGQNFTSTRDGLAISEDQIKEALRTQMWFDLAGDPVPNMVDSLLKFTTKDRLVFGSDVPWTPFEMTKGLVARIESGLEACVGKDGVEAVWWQTAEGLLAKESETEN